MVVFMYATCGWINTRESMGAFDRLHIWLKHLMMEKYCHVPLRSEPQGQPKGTLISASCGPLTLWWGRVRLMGWTNHLLMEEATKADCLQQKFKIIQWVLECYYWTQCIHLEAVKHFIRDGNKAQFIVCE